MSTAQEFAHNATEVLTRLDDERLALLAEILAAVLVTRGVITAPLILRAARELRATTPRPPAAPAAIYSESCEPPGS
jgi:hypothetical protein